MTLCILIPIIVGLICAWLGYLLGQSRNKNEELVASTQPSENDTLNQEIQKLRQSNKTLELEIAELKTALSECQESNQALDHQYQQSLIQLSGPPILPFDSSLAKSIFGKTIKEDDLTVIEGIGPKISALFKSNGITTWKILSETSVEHCQSILDSEGERYSIHNPGTWPRQAKLAYQGKWQELRDWQDILDGGKE